MKERTKLLHGNHQDRLAVLGRDRYCIFCGSSYNLQLAHFISRAQGGLGIPENLAAVCPACHHELDHTTQRQVMLESFRAYLESYYPDFKDEDREYKKWSEK